MPTLKKERPQSMYTSTATYTRTNRPKSLPQSGVFEILERYSAVGLAFHSDDGRYGTAATHNPSAKRVLTITAKVRVSRDTKIPLQLEGVDRYHMPEHKGWKDQDAVAYDVSPK
eukprot:CAMPEP_0172466524 /NCGR_PEP_ID=MMETSP1065-20121228/56395_1 /TAXON_ID=265537 /ORGANISM="Amphiprora paludosa, Strain CCMP125" /LENGTH=113 /DNA_ID=CAMNT_0013223351 /DNA_START=68 /DNA_END=410 /DNA_ORIENTATION=+